MARKKSTSDVSGRVRSSSRSTQRATRSKKPKIDVYDLSWLSSISAKLAASKVLNDRGERPYWLSIPYEGHEPVTGVYPCTMRRNGGRVYYGFMFRDHRDYVFSLWDNARKESQVTLPR